MATKQEMFDWIFCNLPFVEEKEQIENHSMIEYFAVKLIYKRAEYFDPKQYKIKEYKHSVAQKCYCVSSYIWLKKNNLINDNFKLVLGLACHDDWFNWHAWIVDTDKNIIIEPTPIIREHYWGVILTRKQTTDFIRDRIDLVASLNLHNNKFKVSNQMLINLIS